jgi:hypothetical protein
MSDPNVPFDHIGRDMESVRVQIPHGDTIDQLITVGELLRIE